MSTNPDFIQELEFLDSKSCKHLINYFNQCMQTKENQTQTNVNPAYNGRVLYYEAIEEPWIKNFLKNIQENVANRLSKFYNLDDSNKIYPEATHIVKWPEGTSLGDHADNAFADGQPNYVSWRSHSSVIYLNQDYSGGEFYFKKLLPSTIKPKTGMLLGFSGGISHVHGVQEVTQGTRYALPMWFTQIKEKAYSEYR